MESRKISLCITTYNRSEETLRSFQQVLLDDRISEIIIVDDCSTDDSFYKLMDAVKGNPKIKLYRNDNNLGMSRNKARAIELATNEYCIIFDSDNILPKSYLDALYRMSWMPLRILMPSFARTQFDYRHFANRSIQKINVRQASNAKMFDCLMNTCNYFVSRETYLKVFRPNHEIKGSDTIWFNYLWLKHGGILMVVPQMEYDHAVHDKSGFLEDADYNMQKAEEIKKMILAL